MVGFRDRGVSATPQRAIAHPSLTLAVDFGAGRLIVTDASGRQLRGSVAAGLGFGPGPLWVGGEHFEAVQVRLPPALARPLLGVRPADLTGAPVSLDDLWGRSAARLREQLAGAASWAERFSLVAEQLASRLRAAAPGTQPAGEIAWAWGRVQAGGGRVRIDELAAELGWSRKRLWSRFQEQIGLPPKRAARLVRFDHAVHRLVAGQDIARVAADCGYADQSHLHREVVEFTGETPTAAPRKPWLAVDATAWT